jgi:hypothetical protein
MFKKLTAEDVGRPTNMKQSAQRAVRRDVQEQLPALEPYLDTIFPRTCDIQECKGCVQAPCDRAGRTR